MSDRRLTNREVALVLRRAVELEKARDLPSIERGVSLRELQGIAKEAGIDQDLVIQAMTELESRRGLEPPSLFGPPNVRSELRVTPLELTREELKDLIRIVDAKIQAQGHVSEALGTVRWNSRERFLSTQVSFEPGEGETIIRVEERLANRLKYILHFIPGSYSAFFVATLALQTGLTALPVLGLGALGGAVGFALGGGFWRFLARRSARRVSSLVRELSEEVSRNRDKTE